MPRWCTEHENKRPRLGRSPITLQPACLLAWLFLKNWLPEEDTLGRQEARRAAEPTRSVGLGDCLSDGVHPPGLRDKGDVGWYVLRADIAGGEHDLQIRPQTLRRFGQFGSAHAGHTDIREQNLDLGVGLEQLEGVVTVVGVEHLTAEVLHDAD